MLLQRDGPRLDRDLPALTTDVYREYQVYNDKGEQPFVISWRELKSTAEDVEQVEVI